MKIEKRTARMVLILAVVLVAYHAIVFLIPFEKHAAFWISYVFTLVAFALTAISFSVAFKKPDVKSRFYGFPIARVALIYWLVQFFAGIVMMALSRWIPWWLCALVNVLVLSAAVIGLIGTEAAADEIKRQDAALKKDVSSMRRLQSQVAWVASQCQDASVQKNIQELADELQYSDPVSNDSTRAIESELLALADRLQQSVAGHDADSIRELCVRANQMLAERNRLCKLEK